MLKNIDIAKFKAACAKVREIYADEGVPSYLDGIFHFYRCELADLRKAYRADKIANAAARFAEASQPRTFEDFASEVRAAALNLAHGPRATDRQIKQIISLAADLEDYAPLGQHTLSAREAGVIIKDMLAQVERLTEQV